MTFVRGVVPAVLILLTGVAGQTAAKKAMLPR